MNWNNGVQPARQLASMNVNGVPLAGASYDIGNVRDLVAIRFALSVFAGRGAFTFQWYTDSTKTTLLSTNTLYADAATVVATRTAGWSIPVSGPYLVLLVQPDVAIDFNIFIASDTVQTYISGSVRAQVIFSGELVSLPAGNTDIYASMIVPGAAAFLGECAAANTTMSLQAAGPGGAYEMISRTVNFNSTNTKEVYLPPRQLRLRINNGTGVNQTFSYALTAKYGLL